MTPDKLATLASAMGYEVEIDATGGYGVVRVMLNKPCANLNVFRPHEDAAQAWEVLAWLLTRDGHNHVSSREARIAWTNEDGTREGRGFKHNNTPADTILAIVEAAVRVAEGMNNG